MSRPQFNETDYVNPALRADVYTRRRDYADALWWTAMLLTTTGSDFWPLTPVGRVLALLLSIYGLAIFGYIAASLATFFIGQEAAAPDGDVAGSREISALRERIAALRAALRGSAIR